MQNTSCKILSWMSQKMNQDFQVKYQQLQICRWFHINGRMQRGTKKFLDEAKRGECKSCLKIQHWKNEDHGIWSYHFKDEEKWKQWQHLFSWAPKSLLMVTSARKLKDAFHLGRKAMTNIDSMLKSRDITLPTKFPGVKTMVFPSLWWMWELNHKVAEHQRIDVFELWCWRRLLRVTWTARRSNHIIVKEINPDAVWKDWCGSWSSDILATWCYELTHCRNADAGKDWGQKEKGATEDEIIGWHHWLNGHKFKQTPEDNEGQGRLACCNLWCHKESDMT